MRVYKYCFYRFAKMWMKFGFGDKLYGITPKDNTDSILLSSIALVSLIQFSNVNTLLIIPVVAFKKQLSANIMACIILVIGIVNFIFLNKHRLYKESEILWGNEPRKKKEKNKWMVIVFFAVSMIMIVISDKIVYIPHSLSIPFLEKL